MSKRKYIIIVFITAIVICLVYTFARRGYYNNHKETSDISVNCYSLSKQDGYGDIHIRHAYCNIILNNRSINVLNYGTSEQCVKISEFEYYLLLDYAKSILKLFDDETYKIMRPQNEKNKHIAFGICVERTVDNKYDFNAMTEPSSGSLKSNIFVIMLLTIFYSRRLFPCMLVFYFIVFLLLKKSADSIIENKDILKFMLSAIIITCLVDIIFTLPPIYEKYMTGRCDVLYYVFDKPLLRCEVGYITVILQLIAIMAISKSKKLFNGIAYAVPAVWMLLVQQFFLNHVSWWYGDSYEEKLSNFGLPYSLLEKINNSIVFGKTTLWDFADKLRDEIIVFNEFWPFYPKLIYFTLFFAMAFLPFFISCTLLERRLKEGFCKAVVFAAANSLLVCMTSYVVRYAFRAY